MYAEYMHLSRDGTEGRKRQLDSWVEQDSARAEERQMEAVVKRVRQTCLYDFPSVPAANAWLASFQEEKDRYSSSNTYLGGNVLTTAFSLGCSGHSCPPALPEEPLPVSFAAESLEGGLGSTREATATQG